METESYCGLTIEELRKRHHAKIRAAVRARRYARRAMDHTGAPCALATPSGRLAVAFIGDAMVYSDCRGVTMPYLSIMDGET